MEDTADISDLLEVLNGRGATDQDRLRRLKSYLSSTRLSVEQAVSVVKIFDRCEAAAAISAGVMICSSMDSAEDRSTVLAAYKYEEDRKEILAKMEEA